MPHNSETYFAVLGSYSPGSQSLQLVRPEKKTTSRKEMVSLEDTAISLHTRAPWGGGEVPGGDLPNFYPT